jgi:hypothetical protein
MSEPSSLPMPGEGSPITPPLEQGGRKGSSEADALRPTTVAQGLAGSPLLIHAFLLALPFAMRRSRNDGEGGGDCHMQLAEVRWHKLFSMQLFYTAHWYMPRRAR